MGAGVSIMCADKPFQRLVYGQSRDATALFRGFRIPVESEAEQFQHTLAGLLAEMPTAMLVHATGEADLMQ